MVEQQLLGVLGQQGVKAVVSQGETFDPNLHEAISTEASDSVPKGKVISEEMKGYTIHGRLLRPARVVVSSGQVTQQAGKK